MAGSFARLFLLLRTGTSLFLSLIHIYPGLTGLLEDTIGPGFKKDASELKKLEKFKADKKVLSALEDVKDANKVIFAQHLKKVTGQEIDPHTLFDVQVKRMHEYKRQHLNALNIAAQYLYIKNNPNADVVPKTYIFGAKAAPGYYMAKQMIRLICKLGALIDADPMVREKLRVVYLEDYNVTTSERLMPASEVSEQISLAGTEASGTGNMKFMLNGAVTLGTLDGANVEIAEAAGRENEIIFGMLTPEVNDLKPVSYTHLDVYKRQLLLSSGGTSRHWASGIMNHAASCGVSRGSCAACASRTAYPSCFAARAGASSKACGTFAHGMGRGCSRFASRDSSARRRSSFTSLPGRNHCAPRTATS